MKKRLLVILAVVLVFTGVFGGLFTWQYRKRRETFRADGYMIASEEYEDTVVCDYFTAGTTYRKTYGDEIVFTSSMGTKERVLTKSFLHYSDTSISSLEASMVADLDEAENGLLDFYYLAPGMVLANAENLYTIDNNGTDLEFENFMDLLDENKFLVRSGGMMTMKLASGSSQELEGGYLEIVYPEENIVRLYNEESMWQSIASGCQLVLSNGIVIDLGERTVYDSKGTARFTIDDVAMDLASGSGIAVQSDSASQWVPPTFEFEVIDGADGANGENGAEGSDGTNGQDGISGEDGVDSEDGEDGEEGEEGEEGAEGDTGRTGTSGASGAQGAAGANGSDGAAGASGASGASGAGGGTAGGGAGGGGEIGSALGRVLISQLEYDCSEVTFSFYAEDESGAMQPTNNYIEIVEKSTSRVIRRIDSGEPGDLGTEFDQAVSEATKDRPVTLTVQGLSPDTEYQILIYSDYTVESSGHSGNKAYATRTFFTSSEGVIMSINALNESEVMIHLERKNFSQARTARVYLSFEGTDEKGNPTIYTRISDILDISDGGEDVTFSALTEDGVSDIGGLTSNIPFSAVLYTSSMNATEGASSNAWGENEEDGGKPVGVDTGQVVLSKQNLSGRTLKAAPEFGEITCYQNNHGSYQIYLNQVNDPDNAIESYIYRIYAYNNTNLVKTLSTINSTGVELYVDENTVLYNQTYVIECEASYYDNEKTYTALISGTLTTGTGESIVTFIPAEVDSIKNDNLKTKYSQYGTVGQTWMYGYLSVNMEEAGFKIDENQEIMVQVASGEDYTRTLYYDKCSTNSTLTYFYDESVTDSQNCIYNADTNQLFLPVNLWGLKADSYYTFSVSANVHYSDTTSSYKNVGTAIYKTKKYNEQDKNVLPFTVTDITGKPVNGLDTSIYENMTFGISLSSAEWEDGKYPIEVLSARAVEVTAYSSNVPINSYVIDLYDIYGLTGNKDNLQEIWCDEELSPVAQYLEGNTNYMKDTEEKALLLFDTGLFGSTVGYSSITVEVTQVYDYTYKKNEFFPEMESSNMGYQNPLKFSSNRSTYEIGKTAPTLPTTWEAVTATPIMNRTYTESGTYSIQEVLGDNQVDNALDSTTIRGYHLQADYISSEIDSITYYLFEYDDWADFNYYAAKTDGDTKGTKDNGQTDIILAAQAAAKDENKNQPVAYWNGKVTEITIPCENLSSTSAPALNIIYDEDASKNPAVDGYGGYLDTTGAEACYYTAKILRGHTYIAAFTVMDGYTRDENTKKATYWYPYNNLLYGGGNSAILRSRPFQMDRQVPRVKLVWNQTEADGTQEWEFFIYDPDKALGKIELKKEGVDASNQLITWEEIIKKETAASAKWKDGYIMASHYSESAAGGSPILLYANNDYEMIDTFDFPDVVMQSAPQKMGVGEIGDTFNDSSSYSQSSIDSAIDMDAEGRSWHGKFRISASNSSMSEQKYLFLGRSLNDSVYLTDSVGDGGLGWDKSKLTLYTMAAAQYQDDRVYYNDDINGGLKIVASTDTNNLNLSFANSVMDELKRRIVAMEITVWQATTALGNGQDPTQLTYKQIGQETVNYNSSSGYIAQLSLGNLKGYMPGYYAFASVRAVYDTGMYGTAQSVYMEETKNDWSSAGNTIEVNGDGAETKEITLWVPDSADNLPYSLRDQIQRSWYTNRTTGTRLNAAQSSIANSVWKITNTEFYTQEGSVKGTAAIKAVRQKVLNTDMSTYYDVTLSLRAKTALGTGYLNETRTFLATGVGGWNDYNETGVNLVFGSMGIASGSFEAGTGGDNGVVPVKNDTTLKVENSTLITFTEGEAVSFLMPQTRIATTGTDTTKMTRSYNKVDVSFQLDTDSVSRLLGDAESGRNPSYLPYIFVEVYEGTTNSNEPVNDPSSELNGYYINVSGKLVDEKYKSQSVEYLKGPASIYNTLWGAAKNGGYQTSLDGQEMKLPDVFANLAAIPADTLQNGKGTFTISNLPSGSSYPQYSVRLYVLPLTDSNGAAIDYSTIETLEELKAVKKQYVYDNARTNTNGYDTANLHYYNNAMEVWWKLRTYSPAGISNLEVTYEAKGYQDKILTLNLTNQNVVTADTILEFRILDEDGNVKLYNDDIMNLLEYKVSKITKYPYYDENGDRKERDYLAFYRDEGSTTAFSPNQYQSSYELNIAPYINNNILEPEKTYTVQARISHKDPTLPDLEKAFNNTSNLYEVSLDGLWISTDINDTIESEEAKKVIQMTGGSNIKAIGEKGITIPKGFTPFLDANAIFEDINGEPAKKNMNLTVDVTDSDYVLGVYKSADGSSVPGEFYVKVYREQYNGQPVTEVTEMFNMGDGDSGYKYYTTEKGATGIYSNNDENEASYYVEVWGTVNGIRHTLNGCTCGKTHDKVDAFGNIRIDTSEGNTGITSRLTMPDATGIQITDVSFNYNKTNGNLVMTVVRGVGYQQLTGEAVVTVKNIDSGVTVSARVSSLSWNGKTCTFTFSDTDRGTISGICQISINLYTPAGHKVSIPATANLGS